MPKIKTKITIAAPASTIRTIILAFPTYPQWNPFITSASAPNPSAMPGTPITVTIAKFIHQNARIIKNDPGEFSWLSVILAKWVFHAYHEIKFEGLETGACRVVQTEKLGGLIGLLSFVYGGWMKRGFERMNEALKERAERLVAGGGG